ncbi:LysE family translocator [Pseudopelagicola sp. nBUS_19]|uniref:LysE family translocator n=1 Tax=Pseudopelagicola sp. nBUS_19 TaxID=3395316 RepID=UPI003EBACD11
MIPLDVVLVFTGVAAVLAAVPGPDNIFVLTQSVMNGRIAGLIVTLGIALGLFVHTTAVAFGVAFIFQTSQYAFAGLKYAGAAYLIFLAWQAFTASKSKFDNDKENSKTAAKQFLRGFILCISNPKLTIFFLAFLPQFVVPENGPIILQFYQLGALMVCVTLTVFGLVAITAGSLGAWIKGSPTTQIWLNRISCIVFVSLAFKLATAEK